MTIKEVIVSALRKIGREDLADSIEDGGEPAGEGGEVVQTLLYCVNATEDELARYYFPLRFCEKLTSSDNKFDFSSFTHTPVRIERVETGGRSVKFELYAGGFCAAAREVEVTYLYTPAKKTIDERSEFGDMADGNVCSLGAAAEYCLINGETALAEVWETRYREAIDRAQRARNLGAYIPPRRWI